MPAAVWDCLRGNGKRVGIGDVEIAVNVITRRNTGSRVVGRLKRMSGVLRDPAGIDDADRGQHGATVLVQDNVVAHGLSNQLQADSLGLESGRVRPVVYAFNSRGIHEVHLDKADPPFVHQRAVGSAQILLGPGIGGIQRIKLIKLSAQLTQVNRLSIRRVNQPVPMMLVNPGALGNLERSYPNAEDQPQVVDLMSNVLHAERKRPSVRGDILSARVFIAFVHLEVPVPEGLKVLCEPLSVGQHIRLGDSIVESCPAPPADGGGKADARLM